MNNAAYTSAAKDWLHKHSDRLKCDWDEFCTIWMAALNNEPPIQQATNPQSTPLVCDVCNCLSTPTNEVHPATNTGMDAIALLKECSVFINWLLTHGGMWSPTEESDECNIRFTTNEANYRDEQLLSLKDKLNAVVAQQHHA